jgi:hypothetical protein
VRGVGDLLAVKECSNLVEDAEAAVAERGGDDALVGVLDVVGAFGDPSERDLPTLEGVSAEGPIEPARDERSGAVEGDVLRRPVGGEAGDDPTTARVYGEAAAFAGADPDVFAVGRPGEVVREERRVDVTRRRGRLGVETTRVAIVSAFGPSAVQIRVPAGSMLMWRARSPTGSRARMLPVVTSSATSSPRLASVT